MTTFVPPTYRWLRSGNICSRGFRKSLKSFLQNIDMDKAVMVDGMLGVKE